MTRRVLMVAYNFPPLGGVGMLRSLKYATYLPDSGWEPIVLTALDPTGFLDEDALRNLPPSLRVERAFAPEPVKLRRALGRAAREVARIVGSTSRTRPAGPGEPASAPPADGAAGGDSNGDGKEPAASSNVWQHRATLLWNGAVRATFYPDDEVGWVPFAIARGLQIHEASPVDVIYSSSPPISGHLAAAALARQTGLPWIADFRDPWIGNAFAAKPAGCMPSSRGRSNGGWSTTRRG